jgi:hypothetical protein
LDRDYCWSNLPLPGQTADDAAHVDALDGRSASQPEWSARNAACREWRRQLPGCGLADNRRFFRSYFSTNSRQ